MTRFPRAIAILLLRPGLGEVAAEDPGPKTKAPEEPGAAPSRGAGDGRERWASLDEQDREKLRAALREVWTDPEVVSAREEVKNASEAYQEAIREAVVRADPTVASLLERAQQSVEGRSRKRVGGPPPGRFVQRRGGEFPMMPPGFVERLPEDLRATLRRAEEAARRSPVVREARRELDQLRRRDEHLRRQRMEAHRRLRKAFFEAMTEAEPSLRETLEPLAPPVPPSGPSRAPAEATGREGDETPPPRENPDR